MTRSEYDALRSGDVIRSCRGRLRVVVEIARGGQVVGLRKVIRNRYRSTMAHYDRAIIMGYEVTGARARLTADEKRELAEDARRSAR